MKSLSAKTFQCGVTVQGLTTLSGTVYLTALTNTATWDYVVVGTTAQGQLYTRTYAQLMSDITSGIGLSGYVPTSRTLTINGVSYDLTANRSWTISTVDYTSRLQHQVKAGVAINKGQAVYVTSADGTNMIVGLASNASEATSSKTMGLLDATVSTNGFANVVTEGLLAGLDTSAAGTEGDPVWLGTGGNLIYGLTNKPYAPAHLVFIGIVTRKNANNGEIFVKVQNGFELNEIHDVDLKTIVPVNGHILGFDGTLWVNKTIAGWLGYTPANASGTTNYLSKFTGANTLGDSKIVDNGSSIQFLVNSQNANSKFYMSPVHPDGRINLNAVAGTNDYTILRTWHTGNTVGLGNGSTFGSALSTYYDSVLIGTSGALYFMNGTFGPLNVPYRLGITTSSTITYFSTGVENNTTNLESNAFQFTAKAHTFYTGTTTGNQSSPNQYTPLFLSTAGNVVVGSTTDSGYKLEVKNTSGSSALRISNNNDGSGMRFGISNGTNSQYLDLNYWVTLQAFAGYSMNLSVGSAYGVYLDSSNNVGIGTNAPAYKLHVNGTLHAQTYLHLGGNADIISPSSNSGSLDFNSGQTIKINPQSTFSTVFTSTGVGIGTTSPSSLLNVVSATQNSSALVVQDNARKVKIGRDQIEVTDLSDGASTMYLQPNSNLVINSNAGNVGIGTSPSTKLDVNGFIRTRIGLDLDANAKITGNYFGNSGYEYTYINMYNGGDASINIGTRHGLGYISFESGNGAYTERMRITNTGNVGIGTASPSYKLHVNADGAGLYVIGANSAPYTQTIASFVYGGNGNSINIENQGGKASIQARAGASVMDLLLNPVGGNVVIGTTSPFTIGGTAKVSIYADAPFTYGLSSTDAVYLRRYGVGEYQFQTTASGGNSGNLSLQSYGGSVGIGTTSPSQKLDVNGYAKFTSGIILDGGATSHYREFIWNTSGFNRWDLYVHGAEPGSNVGGDLFLARYADNGAYIANTVTFQRSTGNIGIGTTSPSEKLHIYGTGDQLLKVENSGTYLMYFGLASNAGYIGSTNATPLNIITNNSSRIYITTGGNVGIGTTSPSTLLDVNGVITATGGNSTQWNTAYSWGNHSSAGYVPQARTLTINGTSYDLSANRSWTIANDLQTAANGVKVTTPVNVGPNVIASVSVGSYDGATFNYVIKDGTNYRAGTVIAVWNGTIVQYTETTTNDIGTTTSVVMSVAITAGNAELIATSSTPGWTAKVVPLGI